MRSVPVSSLLFLITMTASLVPALAQTSESTAHPQVPNAVPMASTSPTVVPMLVRYDGAAASSDGKAGASMTFLIYKEDKGGQPLWIETQTVAMDAAGKYAVYLGSTYSSGLPPDLFGTGEARWLEVQVAGETPGPRTLLTSVPYAMKAADAATLGGLPASAFVLASSAKGVAAVQAGAITPDASASNVTTTGGTDLYLPKFSGASTVVNSEIYDTGKSVGIGGIPNSSVRLDVNGAMIMRGNMQVTRTGNATTSKAYPSYGFQFYSNVYNSSSKATVNPYFQLQSEPTGNDTASPSATFNLLFSNGSPAAETGFSINPNGTINFASGQAFPGTGTGTITGVQPGSGLKGGGTSGSVTLTLDTSTVPTLTSSPIFSGSAGDGATGDTAGTANGTAGLLGIAGTRTSSTGIAGVWGDSYSHVGVFGSSNQVSGVQGVSVSSFGVQGNSSSSYGVYGQTGAASGAAAGVYGYSSSGTPGVKGASATANGGEFYAGGNGNGVIAYGTGTGVGVAGTSTSSNGVLGYTGGGTNSTGGVVGQAGGTSGYTGIAGVWGDAYSHVGVFGSSINYAGVQGTSSNAPGVQGNSNSGNGVHGVSASTSAVFGETNSSSAADAGLYGISYNAAAGIYGFSSKVGIHGVTGGASNIGAQSSTFANGSPAIWGDGGAYAVVGTTDGGVAGEFFNSSEGQSALYVVNNTSDTDASSNIALFASKTGSCVVFINGDLQCTGNVAGVAKVADGTRSVQTYSVQSAENWYEDAGSAKLVDGVAHVTLEPIFGQTVNANVEYHVFLTPNGDSDGLYVTNKTASGFEVHEQHGGHANIAFDYRIMAKPAGHESQRLADVTERMQKQAEMGQKTHPPVRTAPSTAGQSE